MPLTAAGGLPEYAQAVGQGVYAIDTGYHRAGFDAAYLVVDHGRAAFVDTGTSHAVPRLLATLESLGLARDAVDFVIPTHVHLDHAGGAGALMRQLPAARMLVHPRGARHMIDPAKLFEGALAIYGAEAMARDYGDIVPTDAARVDSTHDGLVVLLGRRRLEFADTPGHALHHHCVWDEASGGWFTGDSFGLSYREFDTDRGPWILATSTPVQFDPPTLAKTVRRLLDRQPRCMYLTHFGRVADVARLGADLLDQLQQMVELGMAARHASDRHARLREALWAMYLRGLRAHGCTRAEAECAELLDMDVELNAQGLAIWLDRQP